MSRHLELRIKHGHGGWRPGAGRKRTSSFQSHVARERFGASAPLHVTLKLRPGLPSLRRRDVFAEVRRALLEANSLAVIHFTVLSNHLHLVVETRDARTLARQIQGLSIRLAKAINRIEGRRGPVFRDRYHVHVVKSPAATKNVLRYVLLNEKKHTGSARVRLGPYSSAIMVSDPVWARLLGPRWRRVVGFPEGYDPADHENRLRDIHRLLKAPRTWLLRKGWEKA